MNEEVAALLQGYAAAKRRFAVELNLLEEMRTLAAQAEKALPADSAALAARVQPLEERLSETVLELYDQLERTQDMIGRIGDALMQEVLKRRYMQQMGFKEIAQAMHYSERHIRRLHSMAMQCAAAALAEMKE